MADKTVSTVNTALQVPLNFTKSGSNIPMPPDTFALAQWLGVSHKILWWMKLNRKDLYDKTIRIPKGNGKVRIINPPKPKLKYLQRMAIWRIFNKVKAPAHVGAYVKKRGVKYTASRHAGHKVIIELDISNFFNSTRRVHVRRFLKECWGWPKDVAEMFADLLTYPVNDAMSVVPQGAPTSPAICNLIGAEFFDKPILRFLTNVDPKWLYTRYSDNLVISHPDQRPRTEVDAITRFVGQALSAAGYRVHPKKKKVMRSTHAKRAQHLLGLTVNAVPNIPKVEYRRLRAMIHTAEVAGIDAVKGVPKTTAVVPHLEGLLNYYLYINPISAKLQKLKARVNAIKTKMGGAVAVFAFGKQIQATVPAT